MLTKTTLVTGLVRLGLKADSAVQRIMDLGYRREEISMIMSEQTKKVHFAIDEGAQTAATAGAGVGMAVGSAVGAVLAAVALVGTSFILPGVGLVVAGPLAAALVGVSAGGVTGGSVGLLLGAGIPEHRAHLYATGLAGGLLLIGVHSRSAADTLAIEQIFHDLDAANVEVVITTPDSQSRAA